MPRPMMPRPTNPIFDVIRASIHSARKKDNVGLKCRQPNWLRSISLFANEFRDAVRILISVNAC